MLHASGGSAPLVCSYGSLWFTSWLLVFCLLVIPGVPLWIRCFSDLHARVVSPACVSVGVDPLVHGFEPCLDASFLSSHEVRWQ